MNCSDPTVPSAAFDHVSLVALYHSRKKVNGSDEKGPSSRSLDWACFIASNHWNGSPPASAAFFQVAIVASCHCLHSSVGSADLLLSSGIACSFDMFETIDRCFLSKRIP